MTNSLEKLCVRWDDFREYIVSSYREFHSSSDFCDMTLVCDDNRQVKAHRLILASSSQVVSNFLKKNQQSNPKIGLRGFKENTVRAIMVFIYTGEAKVYHKALDGFLELSEKLQLNGLEGSYESDGDTAEKNVIKTNSLPPHIEMVVAESIFPQSETVYESEMNNTNYFKKNLDGLRNDIIEENSLDMHHDGLMDAHGGSFEKSDIFHEFLNNEIDHESKAFNKIHVQNYIEPSSISINDEPNLTVDSSITSQELKVKIESLMERTNDKELIWKCTVCGKLTNNKSHMREHVETHITGISYRCYHCDKYCKASGALRSHISKFH